MSTMTNLSVREQVLSAGGSYARQYPSIVEGVISAINEAGSVQAGKDFLSRAGYGSYAYLLDRVTLPTVEQAPEVAESFDRDGACEVIRSFIQDGYGSHEGEYDEDKVDALLVLAGLMDEPVVEPEAETEETGVAAALAKISQTLDGLVEFAKGHGFRG